jgi:hypothetical protein
MTNKDFTPCLFRKPDSEWTIYARWMIPDTAVFTGERECTMHHEVLGRKIAGVTEILPVYVSA